MPQSLDANVYRNLMDKHFRMARCLGLTGARSAEEFYGFTCNEVARLHYHRQGEGKSKSNGHWFRLHDGRVFDTLARPGDPDAVFYDSTTH